jgi:hypothetical protein
MLFEKLSRSILYIDFQIINFTRLEGKIRVSRTELDVVENFN